MAAQQLRWNLTLAEQKLWQALKGRQLGIKFRCQHPIGRFIVDFYCPQCKLIIEVDGEIHTQQLGYDANRTEQLEAYGYQVLRFQNQEVMSNLEEVLRQIRQVLPPESTLT